METELARLIASEWHSGQASPMYALSSSSTIVDGLKQEIEDCIKSLTKSGQYTQADIDRELPRLKELLDWHRGNDHTI